MSNITLRAYNREIENMIESGRIDEAIAHCRQILKSFPKHIDTYRLLGKAYLESQRYSDAADILQRILSAVPDDFVSHLGMSIIREDEGNLDEAIWHMERAFEIQPANGAIQDELRRLFGRRDGLEPPKVRLTRGALARMYAKGDLLQQAIAELRAGLADDPQRFDLQVLLARVYAQAGQRGEAAEASSAILRKLPYCIEANRIMTELVSEGDQSEETQTFRQRVIGMDPYAAYISSSAPTADRVPDQAVRLERLDWKAAQALPGGQPEWAASLGVQMDGQEEQESLPDWLSAAPSEPPSRTGSQGKEIPSRPRDPDSSLASPWEASSTVSPFLEGPFQEGPSLEGLSHSPSDLPPAEPNTEETIPDWMKAAGWEPSTGAFDESKSAFNFDDDEPVSAPSGDAGELPTAEIPEWLRSMAPPEAGPEAEAEADAAVEPEMTLDGLEENTGSEELAGSGPSAAAVPDWLAQGTAAAAGIVTSLDWKGDMEQEPSESTPESGDFSAEPPAEAPDWLKEINQEASNASESAPMSDEVPDWLKEFGQEAQASDAEAGVEAGAEAAWAAETPGLPDWLQDAAPFAAAGSEQPEAAQEPEAGVPDWLKEMSAAESRTEAEPGEPLPDWLPESSQTPAAEPTAAEPQSSGELDDDAAFAWLESLAVKQGATDALLLSDEERQETPPEWVQNAASEAAELAAEAPAPEESAWEETPTEPTAVAAAEAAPSPDLPAWLQEMKQPAPDAEEPASATEVPEWLKEMSQQASQPSVSEDTGEAQAEAEPGADLPDWLREMGQEAPASFAPAGEETEAAFAAEMPEWLKEMSQQAPQPNVPADAEEAEAEPGEPLPDWLPEASQAPTAEPTAAEPQSMGELDDDAAFAWLESLAVKQGATDALLLSDEERQETPPEWVQNAASEAAELAAEAPALEEPEAEAQAVEPAAAEELPDWLAESQAIGAELEVDDTPAAEVFEPAAEIPAETAQAASAESFDMDDDAAFAWLESLAVRQGADEALLLNPDERRETPPEWVSEIPADLESPEAGTEAEEPAAESETPHAAMPDWMQELGAPVSDLAELESTEEPQEAPSDDWATEAVEAEAFQAEAEDAQAEEMAEPVAGVDAAAVAAAIGALSADLGEPPSAESVPAWLDSTAGTEPEQPDVPDWLKDLAAQGPAGAEVFGEPEAEPVTESAAGDAQPAFESAWEPEAEAETQPDEAQAALADALDRLEEEAPILGDTKPVRVRPAEPAMEPESEATHPVDAAEPLAGDEPQEAGLSPVAVFMAPEPEVVEPSTAGWQAEEPEAAVEPLVEEPQAVEAPQTLEEPFEAVAATGDLETLVAQDTTGIEEPVEAAPATEAVVSEDIPAFEEVPAPEISAPAPAGAEAFDLDSDAAFAWLESLAVKQGATDALLLTAEERQETPPEWVQAAADEEAAAVAAETAETEAVESVEAATFEAAPEEPALEPEAVAPVESEPETHAAEEVTETVSAGEAEALEWLKELEDESLAPAPETLESPAAELPVEEAVIAEPEEAAAPQMAEPPAPVSEPAAEAAATEPVPDLPDWLAGVQETPSEPEWVPPADLFLGAPLDINQASLAELERLPGIGFILAQRIVTHRERTGPFESVDDLLKVPGFTRPTLDFVKGQLVVASEPGTFAAPTFEEPTSSEAFPSGAPGDLQQARLALSQGKIEEAVQRYDQLIRDRYFLQDIIRDLNDAAFNRPNEVLIWQALGDAFMRNDQLQEALDAYTRAEELLR